jgi:HlyD family secretion protein
MLDVDARRCLIDLLATFAGAEDELFEDLRFEDAQFLHPFSKLVVFIIVYHSSYLAKKGNETQSEIYFSHIFMQSLYHKSLKVIVLVSVALIVATTAAFLYSRHRKAKGNELVLYGNVDIRQVDLGFRVFGRVNELFCDEGDEMEAGQLMATLDPVPYEENVAQLRAKVASIQVAYANAKVKAERRQDIASESVTVEDYEDSVTDLEVLASNLAEAEAELASSLTSLEDATLYAPSRGIILSRIREPGSVLNPGEPVFTLSLEDPLWIRAYASERELGNITPGMAADIYTDTASLPVFEGHVGFISPVAEFTPKNVETVDLRTDLVYRLRIIVDHPTTRLHQGMPVTVKLKP